MTLPFADGRGSSECRARVVERTKERWSWFSHAQHLDEESNTRIGTLNYLPLETRRIIYDLLFFDQCTKHIGPTNASLGSGDPTEFHILGNFEHEAGVFDFRLYNFYCTNQCCTSRSLRLQHTSLSLRKEYRDNLLASNCFNMDSPAKVRGFLRSLTPHQQLQLRRLTLTVSVQRGLPRSTAHYEYAKYLDWKRICSQLPPTLTSVVIEVMSLWFYDHIWGWESKIAWVKFQQGPDSASNEDFKKLECELLTTDAICKGIKTHAPNASLSVRMNSLADPRYLAMFEAVIAEHN